MPLEATVHIRKKRHVSGKTYLYIHIPSKLTTDSQFRFREGDKLKMVVEPEKGRITLYRLKRLKSG
ncbi:MAG: hypothetical protein NZ956_02310 [Candidatus Caldarchaeum sp.]|nr:hypothetical protein [Candidatus Caldarchaeum sp.]